MFFFFTKRDDDDDDDDDDGSPFRREEKEEEEENKTEWLMHRVKEEKEESISFVSLFFYARFMRVFEWRLSDDSQSRTLRKAKRNFIHKRERKRFFFDFRVSRFFFDKGFFDDALNK